MAKRRKTKASIDQYSIGERVKYLRLRLEKSQAELAEASDVSQSTIAQIESGKKDPSVTTLKKLGKALDVHIAVLFASDAVHVFDMERMNAKYKSVDDLHPTVYYSLGRVVEFAKAVGFVK